MSENSNDKDGVGEGSEAKTEQAPSRRRLLKALAGAGGVFAAGAFLPQKWTSPIVSRVIVPAHAQATGVIVGSFGGGSASAPGPAPTQGFGRRLLDTLIPAANAGSGECEGTPLPYLNVCLNVVDDLVDISVYPCFRNDDVSNQTSLKADGSFGPVNVGSLSVTGALTPTGGIVSLVGKYPGWSDLPNKDDTLTWNIAVSSGGCSFTPNCFDCYDLD